MKKTISSNRVSTSASTGRPKPTKLFHWNQPHQTPPLHSAQTTSGQGNMKRTYTGFLRFLVSGFRYSLTLFSKFFASFPHGTCTLSVSHQYLALDGIYHPLRAAIPNNSTRRQRFTQPGIRESHPLSCPVPRNLARQIIPKSLTHNSALYSTDSGWASPASLAVTRGILVSFFSSA